jgi:hypothetical protein
VPRKPALAQFDSLSLKQLLSLLIREILSRQDLEDCTSLSRPEAPGASSRDSVLDEQFFTISQVAERLNLSDWQVRYAIDKGLIEAKGKARVRSGSQAIPSPLTSKDARSVPGSGPL